MTYVGEMFNGDHIAAMIQFDVGAHQAGDAVIFQIYNGDPAPAPTTFTITAPGWSFTQLGTTAIGATFVATAPQAGGLFTVTSTSPTQFTWINADEFDNNDLSGGAITFDASATSTCPCSQTCTTDLMIGHDGDMLWAGMAPGSMVQPGPGFTAGGIYGDGPRTEYRATEDPAGTTEAISMTATSWPSDFCTLTAVSIKPL